MRKNNKLDTKMQKLKILKTFSKLIVTSILTTKIFVQNVTKNSNKNFSNYLKYLTKLKLKFITFLFIIIYFTLHINK